ncbi:hypothetical protein [Burkholderia pseudomallei]|uniref:hypothetical protein n=1 Tax=Burkholderia pseudomallei TaxID=28450 RepID=UPI000A1A1F16|nr:hypothetical protein [Burkholderia pseudomallei]ARL14772.1 hypothetical protein BOC46_03835 [Burkholderia pseudomallei]
MRQALPRSSWKAMRLPDACYRAWVDDHLQYLDAQRSAFANEILLIEVTTLRQIAFASLFTALRGGWSAEAGR